VVGRLRLYWLRLYGLRLYGERKRLGTDGGDRRLALDWRPSRLRWRG
jgi:hypothetical protein